MVDADIIYLIQLVADAFNPPAIAVLFMCFPVIEGVTPVLAHVGEGVGGHAGRRFGAERLVELEEPGLGPHLRAVG